MPLDTLQALPGDPWPDSEAGGLVGWLSSHGPPVSGPGPTVPASPPPWPAAATTVLVREIQRIAERDGGRNVVRAPIDTRSSGGAKTYNPFGR